MQDTRRRLLIAGSALLAPSSLLAQANGAKVVRIGWLGAGAASNAKRNIEPLRQRLRELNYVEGRNLAIEALWADGDPTRLPGLAKELVRRQVDVIVTVGTNGTQAARNATSAIPIVGAAVGDLSETKLVASLERPGGNVTGVAVVFPETAARQLEVMREVLPLARRVAVLWPGPKNQSFEKQRRVLEGSAPRYEITWHTAKVREDLQPVFDAFKIFKPEFLLVVTDPFYFTNRKELAGFAARARLPAVYAFREFVDEGGLMSYGANILQSYRFAADYVDRIVKGAKPAELPVQISKPELAVNIGAARAVGVSFPQTLLARADIVVP